MSDVRVRIAGTSKFTTGVSNGDANADPLDFLEKQREKVEDEMNEMTEETWKHKAPQVRFRTQSTLHDKKNVRKA